MITLQHCLSGCLLGQKTRSSRYVTGGLSAILLSVFLLSGCADLRVGRAAQTAGDRETALQNYKPLAEFGIPEAQFYYAQMMLEEPNAAAKVEGRKYMEAAAAQGYHRADIPLAKLYQDGIGGPVDVTRAETLYNVQITSDDGRSALQLGRLYTDQNNIPMAAKYYRRALFKGQIKAASDLGDLYARYESPPEPVRALLWYNHARALGVKNVDAKIAKLEKHLSADQVQRAKEAAKGLTQ